MFSLSTLLHLRIPFSYFLMPVYFFALGNSPNFNESRIVISFLAIHLLLYPASNGYNSYFDKDDKSIGGLKDPPPVRQGLYFAALLMDVMAVLLGLQVSILFATMLFIYGMASKAYSHPSVRLKKHPVGGWLVTGFFQGFFAFLMGYEGINSLGLNGFLKPNILIPAALSSVMLMGSYPMTQIYQHEEDERHGDKTISMVMGVRGTFLLTAVLFVLASSGFFVFFEICFNTKYAILFLAFLSPALVYFLVWFWKVNSDGSLANYGWAMWLNFISATCLNGFFIYFFLDHSQVLQAVEGGY
ncbi:MAG: UbiA family prenyltransferase [Cyclobacteriaceae bacterium]|nr:UbiA prenyltransferase family protein [Cyclobacteriaceae bacterium]MCB0498754.1 UbiA prenyltransferase family protein [Cyclobacteriaceae bacterium]MCB9237734.1 UbiA prenyltransferase family protein [Flammeovirgaceae bacterium]MCO5273260.1 UbiA family prenyltransferase [Cyclobacteriaceae bacterium]MCW5903095.1 UbiA prenyltransferase family protein [Cyclobacteriaceae bacterium]